MSEPSSRSLEQARAIFQSDKPYGFVWNSRLCNAIALALDARVAEEREKVAEFMMERSIATGHGDTIEDLLRELYAATRAYQCRRDEEIALRYKLESYIAEQIANAIHNQGDEP